MTDALIIMTSTDDKFVIVLKTGKKYELGMATTAFAEANIPHYAQEKNSSGVDLLCLFQR